MLFERCSGTVRIPVEFQQAFGELAVIQAVLFEQRSHNGFERSCGDKLIHMFPMQADARCVEVVEERETVDFREKLFLEIRRRLVVLGL